MIYFCVKLLCIWIVLILIGERIVLHIERKSEYYIESDDVLDKIRDFFARCLWPAGILWILALLAKIYVEFNMIK